MLIKSADDKSKRLALLEDLQNSPVLDAWQKTKLREELLRLRKGIQGEKEAAFYLNSYFKDGENHALLHDLRVVVDGDVAQIDHLIINAVATRDQHGHHKYRVMLYCLDFIRSDSRFFHLRLSVLTFK